MPPEWAPFVLEMSDVTGASPVPPFVILSRTRDTKHLGKLVWGPAPPIGIRGEEGERGGAEIVRRSSNILSRNVQTLSSSIPFFRLIPGTIDFRSPEFQHAGRARFIHVRIPL